MSKVVKLKDELYEQLQNGKFDKSFSEVVENIIRKNKDLAKENEWLRKENAFMKSEAKSNGKERQI